MSRRMDQPHPLARELGTVVRDEESGSLGILMDVGENTEFSGGARERWRNPSVVAFLRPRGGGREWCVPTHSVTVLGGKYEKGGTERGATRIPSAGGGAR